MTGMQDDLIRKGHHRQPRGSSGFAAEVAAAATADEGCPDDSCRRLLINKMAAMGVEVIATTAPPLIPTPYDQTPMRCPHGVTWHLAPTSEQIAAWVRDGVA